MDQIKREAMKTTAIGVIGTGLSLTLEQYSQIASASAATLTALYMLFKCIDWVRTKSLPRRVNRRKR